MRSAFIVDYSKQTWDNHQVIVNVHCMTQYIEQSLFHNTLLSHPTRTFSSF